MNEAASPAGRARLLVVDDEPANVQALYQALCDEHDISVATNGAKALELCVALQPDLALLDIEMPGMSGYELCQRLKADPVTRDIPVIFVSGRSGADDEAHGFDIGAVDFIGKPVNPTVVRARVRTHLTLKRQSDQLRRMAFIDGLTGAYNRRYFDSRLQQEWLRAVRGKAPLALLLADVDHFKAFNDRYGHQAGDDCLRQVAQILSGALVRPGDLLARYGGEEFACILPDTDREGAGAVGRRLEQALRDAALPHADSPDLGIVTISLGGAAVVPADADLIPTLVASADQALYRAKAAGRARLCLGGHAASRPEHA